MQNSLYNRRVSKGFTLIELLVVIAIIAILAAILFPVFAQAREKARQANCLSNVKQINLGILQYLQDYDERFLPTVTEREGYAAGNVITDLQALVFSIRGRLAPYIPGGASAGTNNVWHCLSSSISWGDHVSGPADIGTVRFWPNDYGFNINEGDSPDQPGVSTSGAPYLYFTGANSAAPYGPEVGVNATVSLAGINSPANFLLLADTQRPDLKLAGGSLTPQETVVGSGVAVALDPNWVAAPGQAGIIARHSGGVTVGFSDGHVKWEHPEATWTDATHNQWRRDL